MQILCDIFIAFFVPSTTVFIDNYGQQQELYQARSRIRACQVQQVASNYEEFFFKLFFSLIEPFSDLPMSLIDHHRGWIIKNHGRLVYKPVFGPASRIR